jgi:hypothetical protein
VKPFMGELNDCRVQHRLAALRGSAISRALYDTHK